MERLQKEPEIIRATENNIQRKQDIKASETENQSTKTKSFMEDSDSVLGLSAADKEPAKSFDIWFRAGDANLDATQLALLASLASDPDILNSQVLFTGIKGGALISDFPGSDLGGVLQLANSRAAAVNAVLGMGTITPSNQTVSDYQNGDLRDSEVSLAFINGNEARVNLLYNPTTSNGAISRIRKIALAIDSHKP